MFSRCSISFEQVAVFCEGKSCWRASMEGLMRYAPTIFGHDFVPA